MIKPYYEAKSLNEFEAGTPQYGEIESTEAVTEDAVFGETEEMELAAELLEVTDENELQGFIGNLISRATGGMLDLAASPHLSGLLCQAAKRVLPTVGGTPGRRLATEAGDLFGLELEGLSPEDQEFEAARRFVRFAGAGARNAARFRPGVSPRVAARRALGAAARSQAPGFLGRRQPGRSGGGLGQEPGFPRSRQPGPSRDVLGGPAWTDYTPAPPIPIEVTCHCCGAQQTVAVPGTIGDGSAQQTADSDPTTLPDNQPANSTEPPQQQTQKTEGTNMHDLGQTTMEISDEADFEFGESQDEFHTEAPFSEEEEAEHAAQLLEISDEQELDQFLGDLLSKARRVVGGALKSPTAEPSRRLPQGRHQESAADSSRCARKYYPTWHRRPDRLSAGVPSRRSPRVRIRGPLSGGPGI